MKITDVLKPKSKSEINTIIKNYLGRFEDTFLPNGWTWRKGQKEAVEQIINTYLENKYHVVILDAPTGAGKSLIAMASAFILNEMGKKGYVLTSEISLQDQYEFDVRRFKLSWGSVKGVDNYLCIDNLEKHSLGTCKIRNINPKKMGCYSECPYFSARDFAYNSDTAILNYNYWLIMQNSDKGYFPARDFTICDEAQKILNIVQNHYSPRFTKNVIEKLQKLSDFFKLHNVKDHEQDVGVIKLSLKELWKTENQDTIFHYLCYIESVLTSFSSSITILKDKVKKDYPNKKPPREWRNALFISDWVKDIHCKVEDYNKIIKKTSTRNIVKNPTSDEELTFNCLEESYMMNSYFHQYTGFTILMSATFSDPREYMRNMNIKGAKYIKMESLFDFSKSPIYYYPKRRMSYKHIDKNRDWLYAKINEIIEKHEGERGIIHSVSYDLTKKINENLTPKNRKRVFVYSGTEEKRKVLDMMKITKGKIIMGPSLTTGLDLYDDLARFAIITKIPYPSLADRFIKTKMNINPGWYQWTTIKELLQAIGRTVRHEKDYCVTYILDGCFGDIIHNSISSFPKEFINRIKIINI